MNLRDMGGHRTRDGQVVREKLLYRSSQLSRIGPDDRDKIARLGLKSNYDLRTAAEREAHPDDLPAGVLDIWLDVLADANVVVPAKMLSLFANPAAANAELGDGKAEAALLNFYRDLVTLPSARKSFSQLFVDLANEDRLPAIIHCTAGKDRTGWAAAAWLSLLGVLEDSIIEDYLRTNDYTFLAYRQYIAGFIDKGGDPAIMQAIFAAKSEYLKEAFEEMKSRYGTIEDYFTRALNIDAVGQKDLRDRFLTRDHDNAR